MHITLQNWIDVYQPDEHTLTQIQVLLAQAPSAVRAYMQAGTPYAEFTLHEIVIVAQKES